jgi:hypothetical protein
MPPPTDKKNHQQAAARETQERSATNYWQRTMAAGAEELEARQASRRPVQKPTTQPRPS